MATTENARLLNLQDQIGTLEIGHKADLILIQTINEEELFHEVKSRAKRIVDGL